MTADLIVLGAGPAGLGAAYKAAGRGRKVIVLERSDRAGGAAGSYEIGGMRVDVGSHRLHPSIDPTILAELRTLMGADLEKRARNGRMRLSGRWVRFPLKGGNALRNLHAGLTARLLRDAVLSAFRKPRVDTYEAVLRAKLGSALCEHFYFPYARKVWGLEPGEISGEQARKRVSADSLAAVAKRALRGSRKGGSEGSGHFFYPKRGYGQISESLATAATHCGAEIRFKSEVASVSLGGTYAVVETGAGDVYEGRLLFSSVPVTALVGLVTPRPPLEVTEAAAGLSFRSMVLVYLVLNRSRYSEYDAHYFPEEWTPVTRVSEPKNYRRGEDPEHRTVLCAEIPCTRGDDLWSESERGLGDVARAALVGADLPEPDPAEVVVRKLPFAYPIYDLGYEARFDIVDHWADSQERLITFGRQGLFVHDNAHHALAMAWSAAECLRDDGSFDKVAWHAARERFKAHVVED